MIRVHFILGCTGSGKGAAGREIARRVGGQIVSVDSMKVYRRMDIGTAKPTPAQRAEIPHHCIDLVEPSEHFSVARFVEHADRAIGQIHAAGAPILAVGGTALYIKALSEGLFEGPGADPEIRASLQGRAEAEGLAALHAELARVDPEAAGRIHPNDAKRIVRALEVYRLTGTPISELQQQWDRSRQRYDCVFIGLRRGAEDAARRINARVKRMIELGLREEVAALLAEPAGLSDQAAQALGYAEMIRHLRGEIPLDEAVEQIKINTRQFAKRQRTWFRGFRQTHWIDVAPEDTPETVADAAMEFVGRDE
ncbi:MAG TPA: tRNA (adenosine(37)-N6)-dimethylallyltransferase MiaA [Phycisphaerae bacterium]|nr:tRNA (adenosine(37)-N6)-dimethylallyltransferase MiaA [Phycisphaerae bacterium]